MLFIHKDKLPGTNLDDLEGLQLLEITPDLIVEVLSPSNKKNVLTGKLADYQRTGVKACWLVNREGSSVAVLHLSAEKSERMGLFCLIFMRSDPFSSDANNPKSADMQC